MQRYAGRACANHRDRRRAVAHGQYTGGIQAGNIHDAVTSEVGADQSDRGRYCGQGLARPKRAVARTKFRSQQISRLEYEIRMSVTVDVGHEADLANSGHDTPGDGAALRRRSSGIT